MRRTIVALLFLLVLVACGSSEPAEGDIQTAIAMTAAAVPTNTPVPPTDTPLPTDTEEPTMTSLPTNTPEPTETAAPTQAPTVAPEPEPVLTASPLLDQYVRDAKPILETSEALLGELSAIFDEASDDPALVLSDKFAAAITENVVETEANCALYETIAVPAGAQEAHDEILAACDDLWLAGASLIVWLTDPLDTYALDVALGYMNEGTEHALAAGLMLPAAD